MQDSLMASFRNFIEKKEIIIVINKMLRNIFKTFHDISMKFIYLLLWLKGTILSTLLVATKLYLYALSSSLWFLENNWKSWFPCITSSALS